MATIGKLTFGKLSNKTREVLRPPKTVLLPAGSALFYEIPRVAKRQQPAAKSGKKKKQQQAPAQQTAQRSTQQPPASQFPQHKVEERKNGLNGQNGHANRPVTNPGRDGSSGSGYSGRSSNLFPSTPRHNTPPSPRREEIPPQRDTQPGSPPVRPTQPPVTRPENKPHPGSRTTPPPPQQEKNGRTTPQNEGSRPGSLHDRRSAWLPANNQNRAGSGKPVVRPIQTPPEPQRKDEPDKSAPQETRPAQPPASQPSTPVRPVGVNRRETDEEAARGADRGPVRQNPLPSAGGIGGGTSPNAQRQPASAGVPAGLSASAMQRILSRYSDLPAQSALLGLCDDGLPVMLDLHDPSPGAMVIIGDEREVQLEMLRSVVASAAMRSSPRALQFVVLSTQPESWEKWISERGFDRHNLGVAQANEENAREWVLRMADWTEDRRTGRRSGPPVLFILDTLSFLPRLELDARLNFDWLAKEGPIAAIWPIAAISTELASSLGSRLAPFSSKVLGYTDDPSLYIRVANVDPAETAEFRKRGEFAVRVGENWLRFRLPK